VAFDDFGARNGQCLYKLGCKGPETYNICAARRWNMEASWPVKAGHPCIGCSERGFWDRFTPFYKRLPHVAGFGVEAEADRVGYWMTGVTAAGIAAHALYTWGVRRSAAKAIALEEKKESPKDQGPRT
jgi:hydrogenase small subunit